MSPRMQKWPCILSILQSSAWLGLLRCPEVHTTDRKSCFQKSWASAVLGSNVSLLLICSVAWGYSPTPLGQWWGEEPILALQSAPGTPNKCGVGGKSLSLGVLGKRARGLDHDNLEANLDSRLLSGRRNIRPGTLFPAVGQCQKQWIVISVQAIIQHQGTVTIVVGILSDQSRQCKHVLSVSDLHKTGQANFQGEKQNKIDFHLTVKSTPLSALTLALTLQHALPGDAETKNLLPFWMWIH